MTFDDWCSLVLAIWVGGTASLITARAFWR